MGLCRGGRGSIPYSPLLHIDLKHIDHIRVRAAETYVSVFGWGDRSSISQNINIRESGVHCHGAEGATLGVIVEGVPNPVSPMAAAASFSVDESQCDFWSGHMISLLLLSVRISVSNN